MRDLHPRRQLANLGLRTLEYYLDHLHPDVVKVRAVERVWHITLSLVGRRIATTNVTVTMMRDDLHHPDGVKVCRREDDVPPLPALPVPALSLSPSFPRI
jgi:hypothetical protein